jgi:hypothetical protein
MLPVGGTLAGSPLIAGVEMIGGDFEDLDENEFLDFSSHNLNHNHNPDTLQRLHTFSTADHKALLAPQELNTHVPFPGSPNGSYPDSSSESATSSKRIGRSSSIKTPGTTVDVPMDEAHSDPLDWSRFNSSGFEGLDGLDTDDSTFPFGRSTGSEMNGTFTFGGNDELFMERDLIDFDSASSSPDAPSTGHTAAESPGMTIKPQLISSGTSYTFKKEPSVCILVPFHSCPSAR